MKTIIDLIRIIGPNRKGFKDLFSDSQDTKMALFIEGLNSGTIRSDQEAINLLYSPKDPKGNYYSLKSWVKNRLYDWVLKVGPSSKNMSPIEKAHFRCNRIWTISNILNSFGAVKTSIDVIKTGIRDAQKYEFSEFSMLFYNNLAVFSAINLQSRKDFEKYHTKFSYYKSLYEKENEALHIFCRLASRYQNLRSLEQNKEFINESLFKLNNIPLGNESVKFIRYYYQSYCLIALAQQQFKKTIKLCRKAISKIDEKPFNLISTRYGYELLLLQCYIQLKAFDDGSKIIERYKSVFPKNSFNWFSIRYYYFILATHSRNYSKCESIIIQILYNKELSRVARALEENFNVFNAYTQFLIQIGKAQPGDINRDTTPFRLGRFLNEVPHFSKDKRGLNISILILQVLFLLHDHKYSKIIDRTDALNQYCYRYLRKDETFRSNCFIKMLIKMVEADFNRIRTERYVEILWNKLQSVPIHVAEQGIEVEIIPYEDLWPMVLEMLD